MDSELFQLPTVGAGESWWFWASGPTEAVRNMALDEALLEGVGRLGQPVLRTYGWAEPAATFGYFQRHADVAGMVALSPLIRRPTGGGLVPHAADWTYSLAVPPGHPWYALSAVESYRRIHQWLQAAFAQTGLRTELAPCCDPQGPGQCFVGAERYDLLCTGRKLAGAAQRRNRHGLLIQGSVQPPPASVTRDAWEKAMRTVATESGGIRWEALPLDAVLATRVDELVAAKYALSSYNEKR